MIILSIKVLEEQRCYYQMAIKIVLKDLSFHTIYYNNNYGRKPEINDMGLNLN